MSLDRVQIDAIYHCSHEEGACTCRKPQTGLFLQAKADFPDIEFEHAAVIGDSLSDMEAGTRLGCRTILVGEGQRRIDIMEDAQRLGIFIDRVAPSLHDAVVEYILADHRSA